MNVIFRDQIYKLACNHWLTDEMTLKPMSTSTTAWTWYAKDFSQGELTPEAFAVRFKTEDQAALFKKTFEECQSTLRTGTPAVTSTSATPSVPLSTTTSAVETAEPAEDEQAEGEYEEGEVDEEDEEQDEEEEYEDVEESIMFEKRCTLSYLEGGTEKTWMLLGTGNLKIVYDDEMLCARIVVEDGNEQLLCDNVIAIETQLKVDIYNLVFFYCINK